MRIFALIVQSRTEHHTHIHTLSHTHIHPQTQTGNVLVSYPLSFYHDLETHQFETGYGGYSPRDEDGTPWVLPMDVETHSSVTGYLGGRCDPKASPALLC